MRATLMTALMVVTWVACGDDGKTTNPTATDAAGDALDTSFGEVTTNPSNPSDTSQPQPDSLVPTTTPPDTTEPTEVDADEPTDATTPPDSTTDSGDPTDVAPDADAQADTTPTPTGESCASPFVVPVPAGFGAPVVVTGDTTGASDEHAVDACAGLQWPLGDGGPDQVWSFTAPTAGSYRITLRAQSVDLGFYVLAGCTAQDSGTCIRGADTIGNGIEAPDSANVVLAANQTVSVVVDSFVDQSTPAVSGAYELVFDPRKPAPLGDTCANAITLQPGPGGYVGSGDTSATGPLNDDLNAFDCAEVFDGFGVQDQVWKFTAPSAGNWVVTVTPSGGADPMIYFHRNAQCNDTCSDFVDDVAADGVEQTTVALAASEVLYIVVDSFQVEAGGPYLLKVAQGCQPVCTPGSCADDGCGTRCGCADGDTCNAATNQCQCQPECSGNVCNVDDGCGGTCACSGNQQCQANQCVTPVPGDVCADARAMTAAGGGAFSAVGNLTGRNDDLGTVACTQSLGTIPAGTGTPDEFWRFGVATAATYKISLQAGAGTDPFFRLYSNASCTTCAAAVDLQGTSGLDTLTIDLAVGTYIIAVDAKSVALAGAYTLAVEPVGTVPVPGDGCALPYTLNAASSNGPWTGSGNLALVDQSDDDEFEVGSCPAIGAGALPSDGIDTEDEVFAFTPPSTGNYRITVTPTQGDIFVQILSGDDCSTATCRGYRDAAGYDLPEVVTLNLDATDTHFIVVDTYLSGEARAYTVLVEKLCTPQCQAGSCADDGCGAPCPCASGEQCVSGLCEDRAGGDCSDPFTLTTGAGGALEGAGNFAVGGAGDDFNQLGCPDLGDSFDPDGDGTADELFAFQVPTNGNYRITVTPTGTAFDLMWGLQKGAVCETSTCIGYVDQVENGAETAQVALLASERYWLVVEPYFAATPGPYTVSVTLIPAGVPGETCEAPFTFTDFGVAQTGTTTGAADNLNGLQCAGANTNGTGFGDVVYRLDAPYPGQYTISLTPNGGADLALYSFAPATGTCNSFACVDASNVGAANGVETMDMTLNGGASAYVVVDGATVAGAYSIQTATTAVNCATDLMFTEYIEGSSNNKGLEIWNGTGAAVNLAAYKVRVQQNGASGVGSYQTLPLTGSLAAGATYSLCHTGLANQACEFESGGSVVQFNGNDSVALLKNDAVIDIIGVDGENPGTSWTIGTGTTQDHTLVRKPAVSSPSSTWNRDQWLVLDNNNVSNFHIHNYFWSCSVP